MGAREREGWGTRSRVAKETKKRREGQSRAIQRQPQILPELQALKRGGE